MVCSDYLWRRIPVWPFFRHEILIILEIVLPIAEFAVPKYLSFKRRIKLIKIFEDRSELFIKVVEDDVQ